jgi:membrane-bound lytic murein transglycosylase D
MAYRGREYGLQRSWWIDERQDPEKSTRAAARHLKDLYREFGDWYLVMAAYNSGPGNVTKGIERTGYADFWELYRRNVLPRETRNYVPIILALTLIAKDPERYAVQVEPEVPLRYDRVRLGHPVDLRLVAETLDIDLNTLKLNNPHLLRMVTPADPSFELRLPEGTSEQFETEMAAIPKDKWLSWRRHRVEPGETLAALARKYGVTARSISDVNSLEEHGTLVVGEKLIIPAAARPQPLRGKLVRYRVRRGDTLESVAAQFDVSMAELKKWNGLRGNKISPGVTLKVYPGGLPASRAGRNTRPAVQGKTEVSPGRSESGRSQPLVHRVREGETLSSIARTYQTTVDSLRGANRFLASRQLQVGDQLMIHLFR